MKYLFGIEYKPVKVIAQVGDDLYEVELSFPGRYGVRRILSGSVLEDAPRAPRVPTLEMLVA